MSAIWALVHFDGRSVDPAHLKGMGDALAPFGSQAANSWCEGPVGLGLRLMPFTPEDQYDHQPQTSRDRRYRLICDGRLDNRPELASQLQITGPEARRMADSAFVLRAIEQWGEDSPAHLIGALAFIAWDVQLGRLFAASTPGNTRSLFYYQTPNLIALATMPRGLLALPVVARELNHARLAAHLLYAQQPRAATFYRDIWRLQSGHTLSAQAGRVRVRRYWAPDPDHHIRYGHDDAYVEAFTELFERIVADNLRSVSPPAIMLSGGLDSSSLAVTAAAQLRAQGRRLSSYTEVPAPGASGATTPNSYPDETRFVQAIAAACPHLDPTFVRTDGQWFVDRLAGFFEYHEAPLHSTSNLVWLHAILQSAQERSERVMLVGEFGNISMSWAGSDGVAQLLRAKQLRRAWRAARSLAPAGRARSSAHAIWSQAILPSLPDAWKLAFERARGRTPAVSFPAIRADYAVAQGHSLAAAWANLRLRGLGARPGARYAAATERTDHVKTAWSGQYGVDVRDPTADQRLVEFCLALPPDQFMRSGQTRWLIRRAMAGRLPGEVLANQQRGTQAADWFDRLSQHRAEMAARFDQFEHDGLVREVLDVGRLRRLLAAWPDAICSRLAHQEYYGTLQEGLMIGCYLLWFQTGGL